MKPLSSLIVLALNLTALPVFANDLMSLEEASKKGFVKLSIKSKGGYTGDVIEMKIKNVSSARLELKLEAGRRLDSKNNSEQDILVTKAEEFFVLAGEEKRMAVFGMCCQAGNHAPEKNAVYSIGKLADSSLVKLAIFIHQNSYYSDYTAQQAVWAVSDSRSIGSITDGTKKVRDELRTYVSTITGKPIPAYDVAYQEGNDGTAMGRATKIEGVFDYALPVNCHATLAIYNSSGEIVQLLFRDLAHEKGDHKLYYTFRVQKLPAGTYYARMEAGGMPHKEMKIEF